jgi:hypothetical protein
MLTEKYRDVEIIYNEEKNIWEFELRGRSRYADSLLKAKEFIAKPVTNAKKSEFQKISAYLMERWSGDGFKKVMITSSTEDNYGQCCWVVDAKGERSKEGPHNLIADTPENEKFIMDIKMTSGQIKSLRDKIERIKTTYLTKVVLPEKEVVKDSIN